MMGIQNLTTVAVILLVIVVPNTSCASANYKANFRIRFRTSTGSAREYAYTDDIKGTDI
ncbi:MAG: hypothetical protein ACYTDW_15935 [Planctomycetota bacterium]|jgi:hypothetical protein